MPVPVPVPVPQNVSIHMYGNQLSVCACDIRVPISSDILRISRLSLRLAQASKLSRFVP